MKIDPNRFRTPIMVQAPVDGQDDNLGGKTVCWVDHFLVYCDVEWGKGIEQYKSLRLQSETFARITARWDRRLTTKHRLIMPPPIPLGLEGGILNVRGVWNVGVGNQYMLFMAEAGTGS